MKKEQYILYIVVACFVVSVMSACRLDRGLIKESTDTHVKFVRYDRVVNDYVNTGNVALWQRMNMEFPRETRALIEDVLKIGPVDKEGIEDSLRTFYTDPTLTQLRMDVARRFEDMSIYEADINAAFTRLQSECPTFVVPKVYTQNSAFNQSIVVGDSLIGVSLDKYLGADYPAYRKYFYENQRATMESTRIVQDCLFFYLNQQYPFLDNRRKHTLGEWMVQQGRIGWVVSQLTCKKPIDVAACQPATKRWYTMHEQDVWTSLVNPTLWNSTDSVTLHSIMMTNDAQPYFKDPHSRGVGLWISMRMIESYMEHHPHVSIDSLLHLKDCTQLLQECKYRGK